MQLDSLDQSWPKDAPKAKLGSERTPKGWQFLGYRFDKKRVPTFRYRMHDTLVEETASTEFSEELAEKFISSARFAAIAVPGLTLTQAFARHREAVAKYEQDDNCRTLAFSHEQLQELMNYENTVFGEVKFEWGEIDAPPDRGAIIPLGQPVRITSLEPLSVPFPTTPVIPISSSCAAPSS